MSRRLLPAVMLMLVLAGCGAPGGPPAEAPPARATSSAAPAAGTPFGIVADTPGGRIDLRAAPGRTARLGFRVVNPGPRPRLLALRAADAGGGGAVAAPTARATGVGAWLAAPARVRVAPRASRAVTARLTVPRGTRPGVYRGVLAAGPPAPHSRASLRVRLEVAARITVRVGAGPG